MRVAVSATLGYVRDIDAEVRAAFADAAAAYSDLGAVVEAVDPCVEDPSAAFQIVCYPGAAQNLRRISPEQRALVDPGLREIAEEADGFSAADLIEAGMVRARIGMAMKALYQRNDLLLTPTLPIPAFAVGQEVPDLSRQKRWTEWSPYCFPFNMTMQPAISVPCGLTQSGLPIGLQIVGPVHDDATVLRAAPAFESVRPFPRSTGRAIRRNFVRLDARNALYVLSRPSPTPVPRGSRQSAHWCR